MDIAINIQGEPVYDIKLDSNNRLVTVDESDGVAQKLKIRLSTQKREWLFDQTMGIDYRGVVVGKAPDLRVVNGAYIAEISRVSEVRRIRRLELLTDSPSRSLGVSFDVETIYGQARTVVAP